MTDRQLLDDIALLSREFGDSRYVRGGGGNTSCKNESTLWIKPSGLSLADMTPDNFVALSRERMEELYKAVFPTEDQARESAVKDFMGTTILPGSSGRPSVEAPLHNAFPQRFVVHTHPALVNGMTCSVNGEQVCRDLFPDALWVSFVEPGYSLSMLIRSEMQAFTQRAGKAPDVLFLGNHGVFIAHDEPDGVRRLYCGVMEKMEKAIGEAGCLGEPERKSPPNDATIARTKAAAAAVMGDAAKDAVASGWFAVPTGAITPDHIVYCKSYMLKGEVNAETLNAYKDKYGYWPRVAETADAVYGIGSSRKVADLALEMAWDGALVVRYAEAFGGIKYLGERFVKFIEGWEVESYRQRLME